MSDHVTAAAVWDGSQLQWATGAFVNARVKRQLKPGDGESFVVRIEREADAKKHWQLKWYFGFCVKQCVEKTGYTVKEMDDYFRALLLPPDVMTISVMTYEQMRDYILAVEQHAAEVIGVVIVGPNEIRREAVDRAA